MDLLLIPDSHSSPDTDNRRFDWLGRFMLDQNPDVVVNIGDHADMNSLSSYDRGKKSFENRRYRLDVDASIDALRRINRPLEEYNEGRRNTKRSMRKIPRKIITLGNHEQRILRMMENNAELDGVIGVDNLQFKEHGWEVVPFRIPICIEGVYFCHYFASGVKGEPISGVSIASSLVGKNMVSSVCGHSHLWDHAIRNRPDGSKVIGLSCGWYGEEKTYSDAMDQLWWSGLVMLRNVHQGVFDVEQYSIDRIRSMYS